MSTKKTILILALSVLTMFANIDLAMGQDVTLKEAGVASALYSSKKVGLGIDNLTPQTTHSILLAPTLPKLL